MKYKSDILRRTSERSSELTHKIISLKVQVKLRCLCTIYNKIFSILFPRKIGPYTRGVGTSEK